MERITAIKLKKLLKNIPIEAIKGPKDVEITGITSNSKNVGPGNLFIAKKGLTVDGSQFIPDAIAAGASAVVTDFYNPFYSQITQVIHPNTAAIEAAIAKEFYSDPVRRLFLVGITGTNGKTTTAYLVRHLLEEKRKPCGLIGTIEWIVGRHVFPSGKTTPDQLQNYRLFHEMSSSGCQDCVMEVSSHALDQGRVESLEFDVAVFTNLTQDHLDYHTTMEEYGNAKAKLFSSLKKGAKKFPKTALVNADSPHLGQILAGYTGDCIRYGIDHPCDLRATAISLTAEGMEFNLDFRGQVQKFASPLIGRYNVYNVLAATGVALVRGLKLPEIAESLKRFSKIPGRLERVSNRRGLHIFVDYAHTEDALANVLMTLQELKKGRLITVFGCGGDRDKSKRPKMGAVAEKFSDLSIITTDNPRNENPEEIIRGILAGLKKPAQASVIVDRTEAIQKAIQVARPEDIVLIAGKGHENYQILAKETIPFDDRAVAMAACRHKKKEHP